MTCECLIAEKSRTWLICHLRRLLAKTCQTITDCLFDGQRVGREVLGDIKDDIPYLEWLVSIDEITMEDFKLITKN